jgi:GGDEF domain-containing protein/2'-5' RNA ligase
MTRTKSLKGISLQELVEALSIKMDNELKIFLQSFKELENLFQALPITNTQVQQLKGILSGIQKNAEGLALFDSITHALNARAGKWFLFNQQLKGIAKIDIYDLRQANKVYGASAVDLELHNLAYQFMSIFTLDKGDFLHRSPGSDEFKIFSILKTPQEIRALLTKPYLDQEMNSLLTWDFGVGLTETEAENELQKQRKTYRPLVLRQTILESHSEIPARMKQRNNHQSWNEFNRPYERLINKICALKLPPTLEQQTIGQVQITRNIVEDIVTRDALTGALNGLGANWYLENKIVQSLALTDMLNMHEGNTRYGGAAIDQDLKRFSNMLSKHFPKREGFLLFRSERAGDEFMITSTKSMIAELESRIRTVWQNDLHRGLLAWNFGLGINEDEAHVDLYRNRVKETEILEVSVLSGKSTFIIVRPESEEYSSLYKLSEQTAQIANGAPIIDLHLTVQAIRNVDDFASLQKRLEEYCLKLRPFEITVRNIVRMNVNNQVGRLWLVAEKNTALEDLYNDLGNIAREMGYESYPYKSQNWLPHIKIVDLPEEGSTRIKDPTFGAAKGTTFIVRRFEWTVQNGVEHWELLHQFPFPE